MKTYQRLARLVQQRRNCEESGNTLWFERSTDELLSLVKDTAPSGSGIDCGTKIDLDRSTPNNLVFHLSYHHMNDGGYYDGWTEHTLKVKPSLACEYYLTISGRDRNDIKEYLHEVYSCWLDTPYEE